MDWSIVGSIMGALALVITAWANLRTSHTQRSATAIDGYQAFCDDLMQRVTATEAAIREKDQEIERLKARLDSLERERVEWHQERQLMQGRISVLETENAELKRELAALKACRQ